MICYKQIYLLINGRYLLIVLSFLYMQIFSKGDFYIGIDDANYFELSFHFGNLMLEWGSPNSRNNDTRSMEAVNRPNDVEITNGNGDNPKS